MLTCAMENPHPLPTPLPAHPLAGLAVATVDSWGRRPLLLVGVSGIVLSLLALGTAQVRPSFWVGPRPRHCRLLSSWAG